MPNRPDPLPQAPDDAGRARSWTGHALARMRCHFWLKAGGITAFMGVFFIAYFHLLRHPDHAVTLMPLTALDRAIAFQPLALAPYVSLWIYVGLPPMLLRSVRELTSYVLRIGALCLAGLACFYLWPTAVPSQTLVLAGDQAFAVLSAVDAAGNACPSLHVATACFTAFWVDHLLHELQAGTGARVLNWTWLLLIAYSTMAIKQHVALDVLAGAALGAVSALLALPRPAMMARAGSTIDSR